MTEEQRRQGLVEAAKDLWVAASTGVGIDEAMEHLHILYGCPRVAEPQGVLYANTGERRHRRKV